eukprot:6175811-Pleurochrysis_carterae.AAC.2
MRDQIDRLHALLKSEGHLAKLGALVVDPPLGRREREHARVLQHVREHRLHLRVAILGERDAHLEERKVRG